MAFLEELALNAGLSASIALGLLAVLWNYSSLPEVRWNEITAGIMAFVSGAGVEYLAADNALAMWMSTAAWADQLTAILYLAGGLLVLVGALSNALEQLQRQYA